MNSEKYNILVVDDVITDLQMMLAFLSQYHHVTTATSGTIALNMIKTHRPDLILLDVNMPEMDGYETCRQIREFDKTIKVIFVSANDSTEEILKGYDAGASDYVAKPFTPTIFLSKIEATVRGTTEIQQLSKEATDLAMEAMTSMGELGAVLTFLRSSFRVANSEALAALMMVSIRNYDLDVCLQLRTQFDKKNYSTQDEITALEEELLARIAKMTNRFAESGKRMFINYENASLIIKNMPIEDDLKVGRLRDNLAILLEGANEKQSFLSIEKDIEIAVAFTQKTHKEITTENIHLMEQTITQLKDALLPLDLTQAQQASLIDILNQNQSMFIENFKGAQVVEEKLNAIFDKLQSDTTTPVLNGNANSFIFY